MPYLAESGENVADTSHQFHWILPSTLTCSISCWQTDNTHNQNLIEFDDDNTNKYNSFTLQVCEIHLRNAYFSRTCLFMLDLHRTVSIPLKVGYIFHITPLSLLLKVALVFALLFTCAFVMKHFLLLAILFCWINIKCLLQNPSFHLTVLEHLQSMKHK